MAIAMRLAAHEAMLRGRTAAPAWRFPVAGGGGCGWRAVPHPQPTATLAAAFMSTSIRGPPSGTPQPFAATLQRHRAGTAWRTNGAGVGPSATPEPGTTTSDAAAKPLSTLGKLKRLVSEYGGTAVVVYGVLWVGPALGLSAVAFAADVQVMEVASWIGITTDTLAHYGLPVNVSLNRWQTAGLLGFIGSDLLEVVRLPATLWLTPQIAAWWRARTAASPAAPCSAVDRLQ